MGAEPVGLACPAAGLDACPVLDLFDELRALVMALDEAGISYAVCGGLAVAIHARPRATVDIDLLLLAEDVDRVRSLANECGYRIESGPLIIRKDIVEIHRFSKPDPETGDLLSLDLLLVTPALQEIWRGREGIAWEGGTLSVVSRAGLIALKRLRSSGQDLDDILALEAGDDEA